MTDELFTITITQRAPSKKPARAKWTGDWDVHVTCAPMDAPDQQIELTTWTGLDSFKDASEFAVSVIDSRKTWTNRTPEDKARIDAMFER